MFSPETGHEAFFQAICCCCRSGPSELETCGLHLRPLASQGNPLRGRQLSPPRVFSVGRQRILGGQSSNGQNLERHWLVAMAWSQRLPHWTASSRSNVQFFRSVEVASSDAAAFERFAFSTRNSRAGNQSLAQAQQTAACNGAHDASARLC